MKSERRGRREKCFARRQHRSNVMNTPPFVTCFARRIGLSLSPPLRGRARAPRRPPSRPPSRARPRRPPKRAPLPRLARSPARSKARSRRASGLRRRGSLPRPKKRLSAPPRRARRSRRPVSEGRRWCPKAPTPTLTPSSFTPSRSYLWSLF